MKKFFMLSTVILGVVLALPSHAQDEVTAQLGSSNNYKDFVSNEDGSVTIKSPRFNFRGIDYNLSVKNNLDDVCRLFGFPKHVPRSSGSVHHDWDYNALIINSNLKFNSIEIPEDYGILGELACVPLNSGIPVSFSRNYSKKFINDDLSATIVSPMYKHSGANYYFSPNADMDGICKRYGYVSYVHNSKKNGQVDYVIQKILIDNQSKFIGFDPDSGNVIRVGSLTCSRDPVTAIKPEITKINADGSTTIPSPRYKTGPNSYPFSSTANKNGVCKWLGFKKYMEHTIVTKLDEESQKAFVSETGVLLRINRGMVYSIKEITCN